MLVELFAGLGFAALYWWEVRLEAILPEALIAQLAQPGAAAAIHAGRRSLRCIVCSLPMRF